MAGVVTLPVNVSLAIIAFIMALVPAGLFLWLWYLRRHDRPVPVTAVLTGLVGGALLVVPAFYLEKNAYALWQTYWPVTSYYFHGAVLPLQTVADLFWPAFGTFAVVAVVEEGLRYLFLYTWFRRSRAVDQLFDGLVIGLAAGLGFATLENSIYFWNLFTESNFDTLVFVFFLRFMVSTLAHISFGGIMGLLLARGIFSVYRPGLVLVQAFVLPWFLHGLFDLLLGINLSFYAVLLLVAPLLTLIAWTGKREFFVLNRDQGKIIVGQQAPETKEAKIMRTFFKKFDSPWNTQAPWLHEKRLHRSLLRNLEANE